MGRWIGVDYGTRRIGLAIGDTRAAIASPAATLDASGDQQRDAHAVARWARHHAPDELAGFVVGLPLNMDGSEGPQAKLTRAFATALHDATEQPVELRDERLTSFAADDAMRASGLTRAKRKARRDAIAAQVLLQGFLDEYHA